jgi:hypothetical protein
LLRLAEKVVKTANEVSLTSLDAIAELLEELLGMELRRVPVEVLAEVLEVLPVEVLAVENPLLVGEKRGQK